MQAFTEKELDTLRIAGRKLARLMVDLENFVTVGTVVADIETKARALIAEAGAESATIGYTTHGAPPFPSAVCVSINDHVVHGIAYENPYVIKNGDLLSLDVVMKYQGLYVDICRSFGVGELSYADQELLAAGRATTDSAIATALVGNTTDDIGRVAEASAKSFGYNTAHELGGHGVGRSIHEKPFVPNHGGSGHSDILTEGMVLAIEPVVMSGGWRIVLAADQWLFKSQDGKRSVQFEETVLITADGPEILTVLE